MQTIGRHRSLELAERHRRNLVREHGVPVRIVARRNNAGRFSTRGHSFTFEWETKTGVYIVRFHYKSRTRGHNVDAEIHVSGPANARKADVLAAIQQAGFNKPTKGWTVSIESWNRKRYELEDIGPTLALVLGSTPDDSIALAE